MSQQFSIDYLPTLALEKINIGNDLLKKFKNIEKSVQGILKLKRKIQSEVKLLEKKLEKKELKAHHICCSNVNQLGAIVEVATSTSGVCSVLKTVYIDDEHSITVDIIGENGLKWFKVIYRDPKALHYIFITGGKSGVRSMKCIGLDFIAAAKLHPKFFMSPKVCFIFVKGVSYSIANSLKGIGIEIQGLLIKDEDFCIPDYDIYTSSDEGDEITNDDQTKNLEMTENVREDTAESNISILSSFKNVNLDVTCLIAYVSATSNGACNFNFEDNFLTEQANSERINPVKIILDSYFHGHNLLVCKPAADHFLTILDMIGGDMEKERGRTLLKRCIIIESCIDILEDKLKLGGRIKKMSRLIFSTGIYNQAPTITSNRGFIRAAQNQGVEIAVLFHDPRALTEKKESKATLIQI